MRPLDACLSDVFSEGTPHPGAHGHGTRMEAAGWLDMGVQGESLGLAESLEMEGDYPTKEGTPEGGAPMSP